LWPQAIVLGSRIEAAKHLLEQGSLSLGEVAYASGFADQSHLTRVLRQATGLTPARYRYERTAAAG
jgi:AraC family transcriptional regulator